MLLRFGAFSVLAGYNYPSLDSDSGQLWAPRGTPLTPNTVEIPDEVLGQDSSSPPLPVPSMKVTVCISYLTYLFQTSILNFFQYPIEKFEYTI